MAPFVEGVVSFFARATHGGQPLVVVYAAPDRAFNERARIQARREGKTVDEVKQRPAAVPFASVWIPQRANDPTRFNPGSIRGFDRDEVKGTALTMRWPQPFKAPVQVDLWCGEGGQLVADQLTAQVDLSFVGGRTFLPVDWTLAKWYKPPFNVLEHARHLGKTRFELRAQGDGWVNNSDLEYGQGTKEVRFTWSGEIEGYLPYRPAEARLVRDLRVDVYDSSSDPPTLLEEDVVVSDD